MGATIERELRCCDSFHSAFQRPIVHGYWRNLAQAARPALSLSFVLSDRSGFQPLGAAAIGVVLYDNADAALISTTSVLRGVRNTCRFGHHDSEKRGSQPDAKPKCCQSGIPVAVSDRGSPGVPERHMDRARYVGVGRRLRANEGVVAMDKESAIE